MSKFQKEFRKSRAFDKTRWNQVGSCSVELKALISVISLIAIATLKLLQESQVEALHITSFRVPPYVPITLPLNNRNQLQQASVHHRHPLDLAKPILLDCDYEYKPDEDTRLTVRWFKNKEAEPFYQWLPELNVRHFADWIKPLVNQSFVSNPHDPMKRYRSLLIRRLSMNLTAQYSCLVSSLASQDMRQASLVVYQPPKSFTFEHQIYPPPVLHSSESTTRQAQAQASTHSQFQSPYNFSNLYKVRKVDPQEQDVAWKARPTQFKGYTGNTQQQHLAAIVRPPNNNGSQLPTTTATTISPPSTSTTDKIVYTHDGRPVRRKQSKRQLNLASPGWFNSRTSSAGGGKFSSMVEESSSFGKRPLWSLSRQPQTSTRWSIQLHHFQCQALQVAPRPVIVLTLKRDTDSIAQYLHESSSVSIRPYQVSQSEYYSQMLASNSHVNWTLAQQAGSTTTTTTNGSERHHYLARQQQLLEEEQLLVTLYDITVSATVALNVSLPTSTFNLSPKEPALDTAQASGSARTGPSSIESNHDPVGANFNSPSSNGQRMGINTILSFRRNQRMSFECHLEITGTEFEERKRISINEEEVFQLAEAEEEKSRLKLHDQEIDSDKQGSSSSSLSFASSSAPNKHSQLLVSAYLSTEIVILTTILLTF